MKRCLSARVACLMAVMGVLCPLAMAQENEMKTVGQADSAFAVDLYQALGQTAAPGPESNLFFSPYSISSALAMTAEGAKGKTAEQMDKVLHLGTMENYRKGMLSLNDALMHLSQNKPVTLPYELVVANALWVAQQFRLESGFAERTRNFYQAQATGLDFVQDAEHSRQEINDWVAQKTHDRIKDLIPKGGVNRQTAMVLTNAIYFKGTWRVPFRKERTSDQAFHLSESQEAKAPMMQQLGLSFPYAETDDAQIVSLPYKSLAPGATELSMLIVLPKKVDGLAGVERQMSAENLAKWTGALKTERVQVYLPRFSLTGSFELSSALSRLGMSDAFTSGADFSGMSASADNQLFISSVVHKAFVDVNEEGTEAAAATGVMMGGAGRRPGEPAVFRADHPFLFMIRHEASGAILFMGRMTDPGEGGH